MARAGNREKQIHFLVNESEAQALRKRMEEMGIHNMGAYLRKMALNGYCVRLDLDDVKELVSLLRYCSNNLNQYAKKANETGSIHQADIIDLKSRLDEIWNLAKEILVRLSQIN